MYRKLTYALILLLILFSGCIKDGFLDTGGVMIDKELVTDKHIEWEHQHNRNNKQMDTYCDKLKCVKCGKTNDINIIDSENGLIYECETTCRSCGHRNYWAHGSFIDNENKEN